MALFVHGEDVSTAWLAGLEALLAAKRGDAVNLTVAIDDPTAEDDGIRSVLDEFNGERRRRNRSSVELVSTSREHGVPRGLVRRTPRRGR